MWTFPSEVWRGLRLLPDSGGGWGNSASRTFFAVRALPLTALSFGDRKLYTHIYIYIYIYDICIYIYIYILPKNSLSHFIIQCNLNYLN